MIAATKNDKAHIVDLLTRAFDDNHSVNYVAKQDSQRQERIRALMAYSFEVCQRYGEIYLSDDKQACIMLLFPGRQKSIIWLDIQLILKCIGISRIHKILARNSAIKKEYPKEPVTYLWFIGVIPHQQGNGLGSALLNDVLALPQYSNKTMLLETSMSQNLLFYKSFGFEIYKELEFGHRLYLLKRPPVK